MQKSFMDAQNTILNKILPLPPASLPLIEAIGLVLAEDVYTEYALPAWNNSAMDGFAVRSQDCFVGKELEVVGEIYPGELCEDLEVLEGCAVRIMTGAPVPDCCDAVVPIEETTVRAGHVIINSTVVQGNHVRQRGEDYKAGELAISKGTILRPAEVSLLAAISKVSVSVYPKARVAILSTGNELVALGEPLTPGKIVDSNSLGLASSVKSVGAEPVLIGIASDDLNDLRNKLELCLKCDLVLTSAGVSIGDKDFVREALQALGAESVFWKVNIKPGRPTAFAEAQGKPVFSLPGNPVSSLLTFEMFVKPALLKMMGSSAPVKTYVKGRLSHAYSKKAGRLNLLRVRAEEIDGELVVTSTGDQNTGILKTLVQANAIAILPEEKEQFSVGEEVDVYILSDELTKIPSSEGESSCDHRDMTLLESVLTRIGI
jgi:molybdopterin molybdotransferase